MHMVGMVAKIASLLRLRCWTALIVNDCTEVTVEVAVVAQFHSEQVDEAMVAATFCLSEMLGVDILEVISKLCIHLNCPPLTSSPYVAEVVAEVDT